MQVTLWIALLVAKGVIWTMTTPKKGGGGRGGTGTGGTKASPIGNVERRDYSGGAKSPSTKRPGGGKKR